MWGMLKDRVVRTARLYSKWNRKHFKTRMPMCAEKYFQRLQGLLRSWRFTLKDCALEKGISWTSGGKWAQNSWLCMW
jgi:hypothetical protein